jgi:hypothetical protein
MFGQGCSNDVGSGGVFCNTGFVARGAPVLEPPARFALADWFMWLALAVTPPLVPALIAFFIRNALKG